MKAETNRPFLQTEGFTLIGNEVIIALITSLLYASGPAAVVGRVTQGIILAINRMRFRWSASHVGQKVGESVLAFPLVAHGNSPAAVSVVVVALGISCTLEHLIPTLVSRRPTESMFPVVASAYNVFSQDVGLRSGLRLMRALVPWQRLRGSFYVPYFTTELCSI